MQNRQKMTPVHHTRLENGCTVGKTSEEKRIS